MNQPNRSSRRIDWIDVIIGVILVITGIFVLSNVLEAFLALASLLGMVIVVRGILLLVRSIRIRRISNRVVSGVIGIIVGILLIIGGIYLLVNPTLSMIALGTLVGFWFIFEGIGTILDGQIIRLFSPGLWIVQLIFSIIMIAAGVMLLGDWLQGGLTAATLIGIMLLLNGIMRGVSGFSGD